MTTSKENWHIEQESQRSRTSFLFALALSGSSAANRMLLIMMRHKIKLTKYVLVAILQQMTRILKRICNTVSLLVVSSHCCQFQSLQFSCCFQLYLVVRSCILIIRVNMTRLDQLSYPRVCYNCNFNLKTKTKKCMYVSIHITCKKSRTILISDKKGPKIIP